MTEQEDSKETRFDGTVRQLRYEDLPSIRPILETWIRYPVITGELIEEEIEEVMAEMQETIQAKNSKTFYVAEKNGQVVGVMGVQPLRQEMIGFAQTGRPAEIINANVALDQREQGVGRAIVSHIESEVQNRGYKEILLNSGLRYEDTGWPFWRKLYGEPVGEMKDFYGAGFHAKVWRKVF